jgi:uncharacterized membrane protein HdeD (DUF308 family)
VLRGLFAVLFVLAAFLGTFLTLVALVLLFGAYSLADGILGVTAGLTRHAGSRPRWLLLTEGLIGIVAGVLSFLSPGLAALVLLYLIVAWAIVTGTLEIISAIRLRKAIEKAGLLVLSSILPVAVGMMLVVWPGATALGLMWLIGAYALAFGLLQIGLGFRVRRLQKQWLSRMAWQPVQVGVNRSMQE